VHASLAGTITYQGTADPTWGVIFESSKLKVSFATIQCKETFELGVLSFETAFENVTPSGIGCTFRRWDVEPHGNAYE